MKKEDILYWMDKQIDINRSLIDNQTLCDGIMAYYPMESIHIHKGIEKCAEAAGVPCKTSIVKGENIFYPFKQSFTYRGTEFFQLSEEECSS